MMQGFSGSEQAISDAVGARLASRVPAVERQAWIELVRQAGRGIEAIELVKAVQIVEDRIAVVLDLDARVVDSGRRGSARACP